MKKVRIRISGVDEKVLEDFRSHATQRRMKMGDALTEAMNGWIKEAESEVTDPKILLQATPFNWGPGTSKTSAEIDSILYG